MLSIPVFGYFEEVITFWIMKRLNTLLLLASIGLLSCQSGPEKVLKESLTFFASFDNGVVADYGAGDNNIYTAPSQRAVDSAQAGMNNADHKIVEGQGRFGDAFRFGAKSPMVLFYRSQGNIAFDPKNWSGTISFWLRVDPEDDLEPGYTDPIQITDVRYNDASIWVDFTTENPRDFRLGVFGDLNVWSKDTLTMSQDEAFEKRLVRVKTPPFTGDRWTHVVITYQGLGSGNGLATLYLDGTRIGSNTGIEDPFTWDLTQSNIFVGLNFIGLMDELAIFNTPFDDEQVMALFQLKEGVKAILE